MTEMVSEAIDVLESAVAKLKIVRASGNYSVEEMREIRTALMRAVKFNIEPLAQEARR